MKFTSHLAFNINRKLPKNIVPTDVQKFENEVHCELGARFTFIKKNVFIVESKYLFQFKEGFLQKYCLVLPRNPLQLLPKLLLLLFGFQNKQRGIWVTDNWSKEYYHWFADALCRYYQIKSTCDENGLSTHDYPLLIPEKYVQKAYIRESLNLLGIKYLPVSTNQRVHELIVTDHPAFCGGYYPPLINKLHERFRTLFASPNPTRKIFISREKSSIRRIENEASLYPILQQFGYEVHYFEAYSFQLQMELMSQSISLISSHGAGLINMLFMPEKSSVVELISNQNNNNCYYALATDLQFNYYYLHGNPTQEKGQNSNIVIDVNAFTALLLSLENQTV
jgi:capsular polysaccharide biosynthesis protein